MDKAGYKLVSGHSRIDLPYQVIAGDDAADNFVYFRYSSSRLVFMRHDIMLELSQSCVKEDSG